MTPCYQAGEKEAAVLFHRIKRLSENQVGELKRKKSTRKKKQNTKEHINTSLFKALRHHS